MNRFSPALLNYLDQYAQGNYKQSPLKCFTDTVFPFLPGNRNNSFKKFCLFTHVMDEFETKHDIGGILYTENMLTLLCFLIALNDNDLDAFIEEVSSPNYGSNAK